MMYKSSLFLVLLISFGSTAVSFCSQLGDVQKSVGKATGSQDALVKWLGVVTGPNTLRLKEYLSKEPNDLQLRFQTTVKQLGQTFIADIRVIPLQGDNAGKPVFCSSYLLKSVASKWSPAEELPYRDVSKVAHALVQKFQAALTKHDSKDALRYLDPVIAKACETTRPQQELARMGCGWVMQIGHRNAMVRLTGGSYQTTPPYVEVEGLGSNGQPFRAVLFAVMMPIQGGKWCEYLSHRLVDDRPTMRTYLEAVSIMDDLIRLNTKTSQEAGNSNWSPIGFVFQPSRTEYKRVSIPPQITKQGNGIHLIPIRFQDSGCSLVMCEDGPSALMVPDGKEREYTTWLRKFCQSTKRKQMALARNVLTDVNLRSLHAPSVKWLLNAGAILITSPADYQPWENRLFSKRMAPDAGAELLTILVELSGLFEKPTTIAVPLIKRALAVPALKKTAIRLAQVHAPDVFRKHLVTSPVALKRALLDHPELRKDQLLMSKFAESIEIKDTDLKDSDNVELLCAAIPTLLSKRGGQARLKGAILHSPQLAAVITECLGEQERANSASLLLVAAKSHKKHALHFAIKQSALPALCGFGEREGIQMTLSFLTEIDDVRGAMRDLVKRDFLRDMSRHCKKDFASMDGCRDWLKKKLEEAKVQ